MTKGTRKKKVGKKEKLYEREERWKIMKRVRVIWNKGKEKKKGEDIENLKIFGFFWNFAK